MQKTEGEFMRDEATLTLKLDYKKPVELADMSLSLYAMAAEFNRFSDHHALGVPGGKLYLYSVSNGSFIAELQAISGQLAVFADQMQAVSAFIGNIKVILGYLLGKHDTKPEMDKKQLEGLSQFLEPVAKDREAQWVISHNHIEQLTINYQEANAAQRAASREMEAMKEAVSGVHTQVVLAFRQIRNHPDVGNRGVIESISKAAIKTIFADSAIHDTMLMGVENPLKGGYLVDVRVETIDEKPTLYKIIRYHERIEVDD